MGNVVTLRSIADRRFLDAIDIPGDKIEKLMGPIIRRMLEDMVRRVSLAKIGRAIEARNAQVVLGELSAERLAAILGQIYSEIGEFAAEATALTLAAVPSLPIAKVTAPPAAEVARRLAAVSGNLAVRWGRVVPEIQRAMERRGAELVKAIDESTRRAIRAALIDAFAIDAEGGKSREQLAREIRELVGLTPRQTRTFERRADGLSEKGRARLKQQMIRKRARLIARHESANATNAAQLKAWEEARELGVGIEGLGGEFRSDLDEMAQRPPLHVGCRCALRLIRDPKTGLYGVEWVARMLDGRVCPRCAAMDGKIMEVTA